MELAVRMCAPVGKVGAADGNIAIQDLILKFAVYASSVEEVDFVIALTNK